MNSTHYAALRVSVGETTGAALTIELVFAAPTTPRDVAQRIQAELPGTDVEVETAFGEAEDNFIFATFRSLHPQGRETEAFGFARDLADALGAVEANPVLEDSLYGGLAVSDIATEAALASCETPKNHDLAFGWVHPVIRTVEAWNRTRGAGSTVAVIDTGYSSHQELRGVILENGQANFVEGGTDARDRFTTGILKHPGHGTLVCSVVGSRGTADASGKVTGGAVTGSAPEAKILPIRAITSVVSFKQRTIPRAISHAVGRGADVIAMALGGPSRVASTEKALRDAVGAGCVIVCAAGNCWPKVVFPAAYASEGLCCAAAALRHTLEPWARTGRGPEVTIAAPGENVWGAAKNRASDPDHGVRSSQGTTLATSLTAGVAALWVARHGGRSALQSHAMAHGITVQSMFNHCLTAGISKPPVWGGATNLGAGVLDAAHALSRALPTAVPESPVPTERVGVMSNMNLLAVHLANHAPEAADDLAPDVAPFAGEILWRSYRAAARERAREIEALGPVSGSDASTSELRNALTGKPGLRAFADV